MPQLTSELVSWDLIPKPQFRFQVQQQLWSLTETMVVGKMGNEHSNRVYWADFGNLFIQAHLGPSNIFLNKAN